MGVTVHKKKTSGDWYVWISHKGKRTSRKIGKDKRTALKAATQYRKKLALGQVDFSNGRKKAEENLSFGRFSEMYLNEVAKHRLKHNTWKSYQGLIKAMLLPTWESKPLTSITKQEVRRLLFAEQSRGIKVNNLRICISAVFAEAVERELVPKNPAHGLGKVFRGGIRKGHIQILTKEQVGEFLDVVKEHRPEHCEFLFTAFRTGLRLGELLALAWDFVDFNAKQIVVRRSFSHKHWDTPKSHKVRHVDMSDKLHNVLGVRFERHDRNLPCKTTPQRLCLVLPNRKGGPIDADLFRRRIYYPLLNKANLPQIRIHDMRHTYASLLLQAGAPLHYVKDQLGHSSIATTVDLYGHIVPGLNRDVLNMLD